MSRPRDRRDDSARADESATSSNPSSPEPTLDDDADSFAIQSNESQSSFGATVSRDHSPSPSERSQRPKVAVESLPPELLIFIFQKLSSTQDLYNCVRVCKKWARCSVELLWHRPLFTDWAKLTKVAHAIQDPKSYWMYTELIKRLNLSNLSTQINDGTLQPFSDCKRIERLTLTSCVNLTDQGIIRLVEGNRSLLALDITGMSYVTDETIQALAKNCPRLQGLNVTSCSNITDNSLVPLANACKYLKRLKLNKCALVTDSSIEAFATRCPSMLEIDLQGCDLITDPSVTALLQKDKYLRELRLASCQKITDQAFLSISSSLKLDSLRILDLTACFQLTDAAVEKMIESAPRLRILVLAKCVDITDRAVYAISKLGKNLHDIHLGRCVNISDAALKELVTKCNRIRYIDLAGCARVTDDSIKMLANLPKLRRIGLVKCTNITDASIRALARGNAGQGPPTGRSQLSSSLERVHLSYCVNITLEGINDLLRKCPKLTHLSLTGIQAFFQRDDLVSFCREAPPEFNEEQRMVFCVFSGDGVNRLREHLANDPSAYGADDVSMYDDGPDSSDDVVDGEFMYGTAPYYIPQAGLPALPYTAATLNANPALAHHLAAPPGTVNPAAMGGVAQPGGDHQQGGTNHRFSAAGGAHNPPTTANVPPQLNLQLSAYLQQHPHMPQIQNPQMQLYAQQQLQAQALGQQHAAQQQHLQGQMQLPPFPQYNFPHHPGPPLAGQEMSLGQLAALRRGPGQGAGGQSAAGTRQPHGQPPGQMHDRMQGQMHGQLQDRMQGQVSGQIHDRMQGQISNQMQSQMHVRRQSDAFDGHRDRSDDDELED